MFTFLFALLALYTIAQIDGDRILKINEGRNECAAKWGFWLTKENSTFREAFKKCQSLGLKLVPIKLSDLDPMNPVLRYMAGRVAEQCNITRFWIDSGLYISGAIVEDMSEIDKPDAAKHCALCYEPTIEYPDNAPPAQSIIFIVTTTKTGTVTRPFDLDIIQTEIITPEPPVTEYASKEVTEIVFVTQTFSIPTSVKYGKLVWHKSTEKEIHVQTEIVGISTITTTRTITVTTSVIAVLQQVLTVTSITRCPDKVSGFVRVTVPTDPIDLQSPQSIQPVLNVVTKNLICDRFSSLSEIKVCDTYDHDFGSLMLITTPISFSDAECSCNALGLSLADMTSEQARSDARKILKFCFDIPGQGAWIKRLKKKGVEVCMAIGSSPKDDGPVACVQELPIFCH